MTEQTQTYRYVQGQQTKLGRCVETKYRAFVLNNEMQIQAIYKNGYNTSIGWVTIEF
jgi:hypothetical protein